MNPAYFTAPFEVGYLWINPEGFVKVIYRRDGAKESASPFGLGKIGLKPEGVWTDDYPIRLDENGYVHP